MSKKLLIPAFAGLVGFFGILLAWSIFMFTALVAVDFPMGGGTPSLKENLILYGFVPVIVIFSAAIPAWSLGANRLHGFLSGIMALIVLAVIESNAGQPHNYGYFSKRETLAYIAAIFVSILTAMLRLHTFQWKQYFILAVIAVILVVLRQIMPQDSHAMGLVLSLLAWILLPLACAFLVVADQKSQS